MPDMTVLDHTDPVALRSGLISVAWGTVTMNGVTFLVCPACQAMMVSVFTSPSVNTPRDVHIDYHVGISSMISDLTKELQRRD